MDDFAKAAVYSFAADADPALHAEATSYYQSLKCADGFRLCVQRLISTQDINLQELWLIRFFCLRVIEDFVTSDEYENLPAENKMDFRNKLMSWVSQPNCLDTMPPFCGGKLAHVFAILFQKEYLRGWQSFFLDFLGLLSNGDVMTKFFIQLTENIHFEVVDKQIFRSQMDLDQNTAIKDKMRIEDTKHLAEAWYTILMNYSTTNPNIVSSCLNNIGFYVSWIDVNLIVNDSFLPAIYSFLENNNTRESACDCISAIVEKGMLSAPKVQLIESLGIVNVIPRLMSDDEEFMTKLSLLSGSICRSLIVCCNDHADALRVLNSAFPILCLFFENEIDDISEECIIPIREYLAMVKVLKKASNSIPPAQNEHLNLIMMGCIKKLKYDVEYNFDHRGENEDYFEKFRKDVLKILISLAGVDNMLFLSNIETVYTTTLTNVQTQTFTDIEVALKLFYLLMEGLSSETFKTEEHRMFRMIDLLFSSNVVNYQHMAVTLNVFDIVSRYSVVLASQQQYIQLCIEMFFSEQGVTNSHPTVRAQVCYNLVKFVKPLRDSLKSLIGFIITQLQPFLQISAQPDKLVFEDQSWLYEVVGILASSKSIDTSQQEAFYESVTTPLFNAFTEVLDTKRYLTLPEQNYPFINLLCKVMTLMSKLSSSIDQSHPCASFFLRAYEMFQRIFEVPINQQQLCVPFIKYLHRMVECFDQQIIEMVPGAIERLFQTGDIVVVTRTVGLLTQLSVKTKERFFDYTDKNLMNIIGTIFVFYNTSYDPTDKDCVASLLELKLEYFRYLQTLCISNLQDVFTSQNNAPHVNSILETALQSIGDFSEPIVQVKSCLFIKSLCTLWATPDAENFFTQYLLDNVATCSLGSLVNPENKMEDARSAIQVVDEVASLHRALCNRIGARFVEYMSTTAFPALLFTSELTEAYCQNISTCEDRQWRNFFRQFVESRRQLNGT